MVFSDGVDHLKEVLLIPVNRHLDNKHNRKKEEQT